MPKAKKDPSRPKRPKSGYLFFVEEERQKLTGGGGGDFGKVSKEIGERWGKLSSEDKKPYEQKAAEDKKRYEKEMENYTPPSSDDEGETKTKRKKKKKDPDQPKRNLSGFMFFASEKRPGLKEKNPNATIGEISQMIGAEWQSLDAEAKKPYEKMAADDKIRYQNEMEKYNANKSAAEE